MILFNENLVLRRMEEILNEQLKKVKIIGDIPVSKKDFEFLAGKIRVYFKNGAENELFIKYGACLITYLVFAAVYYYEEGTYWPFIEKDAGKLTLNQRSRFYSMFSKILKYLNLHEFKKEQEEGFKYVTPIICHSGIPQSCLDDYFDVVSETINNTNFFEGHILDEFKYFMRLKVKKPVIRYFDFLEDEAENFLQNCRELIFLLDSQNITIDEAVARFPDLRKSLIEKYFEWQSTDRAKDKLKSRKNVTITSPKIMLDVNGAGVYVFLPSQIIKDCFDNYISWEISVDENTFISKAMLTNKNDVFTSEEKSVILSPSQNYKVTLFVEDKLVSVWDFKGLSDNYICFDKSGNLIRKASLPQETVTIIFNKNHNLEYNDAMTEELPFFPKWINYKAYRINLSNIKQLVCSFGVLEVKKETRPILTGGKKVFASIHETANTAYTSLPEVSLNEKNKGNWYITVSFMYEKKEIYSKKESIESDIDCFSLREYIPKNDFGEYLITVWNPNGNSSKFFMKYVPDIEFYYDNKTFWPSSNNGYSNDEFYCRYSKSVSIEFQNAMCFGNILLNGRDFTKFIFNNEGRYVIGTMKYKSNGYRYNVSIKKSLRPIMWAFIGFNDVSNITWCSTHKTFSKKDFENNSDVNLVISVDDIGKTAIKLNICLYSRNGKIINSKTIHAESFSNHRIPLNIFLSDMNSLHDQNFSIVLSALNSEEEIIFECLLAKIKEGIIWGNVTVENNENETHIFWTEQGSKCYREVVVYNCLMPWEPIFVKQVEDKICEIYLNTLDMVNSVYAIQLREIEGGAFFDTIGIDIPKLRVLKRFTTGKIPRELYGIKKILSNIMEVAYKKPFNINFDEEINKLSLEGIKEEIEALSITYLFYISNAIKNEPLKIKLNKVFKRLFSFFYKMKFVVLKTLLNMELEKGMFEKLAVEFNLLNIQIEEGNLISPVEREFLWNSMPSLAFTLDIQLKFNSGRLCNWVGDNIFEEIILVKESYDIRECLNKLILRECDYDEVKFNLTDEVFGSSKHIVGFFENLTKGYNTFRRLDKHDNAELYRSYERDHSNKELRIFGKSYFMTVQDWTTSINKSERRRIEEKLKKVIDEHIDIEFIEKKYPDIYNLLLKRTQGHYFIEFYEGLIVFTGCLSRKKMIRHNPVTDNALRYIYKKYYHLFIRDLILFETYLLIGGVK